MSLYETFQDMKNILFTCSTNYIRNVVDVMYNTFYYILYVYALVFIHMLMMCSFTVYNFTFNLMYIGKILLIDICMHIVVLFMNPFPKMHQRIYELHNKNGLYKFFKYWIYYVSIFCHMSSLFWINFKLFQKFVLFMAFTNFYVIE